MAAQWDWLDWDETSVMTDCTEKFARRAVGAVLTAVEEVFAIQVTLLHICASEEPLSLHPKVVQDKTRCTYTATLIPLLKRISLIFQIVSEVEIDGLALLGSSRLVSSIRYPGNPGV